MPEELAEILHVLLDGISMVAGERDRLHELVEKLKAPAAPAEPA